MSRPDAITVEGTIDGVLKAGVWWARLANGHRVLVHTRWKDRSAVAGLTSGDRVKLELSPFDMSKGRIVVEPTTTNKITVEK